MTQGNVSSDDDVTVVVEKEGQEPPAGETKVIVEETTEKNVTKVSADEAESNAKRSSQIIAKLGEEKKAIVGQLVQLAKDNPDAQVKLKEMVSADASLSDYVKVKFGSEYDSLIKTKSEEKVVDIEKVKAEQYARARADVIFEQLEQNKTKTVDEKAQSLGFNSSEIEGFRSNVTLLTGAGENFETALEKAAILTNSEKSLAGRKESGLPPSGGTEQVQPTQKVVKISSGLANVSQKYGGNQGMAKVVDKVKGLTVEDEERNWLNGGVMQLPDIDEKTE